MKNAPVVAYATTNEDGDLSMLFFDEQEARKYSLVGSRTRHYRA